MLLRILLLACLFILVGCASRQQKLASIHGECVGYGYQEGTPDMTRCVQLVIAQRRQESMALLGIGTGMVVPDAPAPYRPPQVCTEIDNGRGVKTTVCP